MIDDIKIALRIVAIISVLICVAAMIWAAFSMHWLVGVFVIGFFALLVSDA